MLLLSDGRFDDGGMKRIRNQADDEIVLGKLSVKGVGVGDVEGDGGSVLDSGREGFGGFKSPASCRMVSPAGIMDDGYFWQIEAIPTVTETPD